MKIDFNTDIPKKFLPLLMNQDRFLIMKGSAGSGKSVFATKKLVFRSLYEQPHRHLVLRKIGKDIEDSIFHEIEQRISEWKLKNRVYINIRKGNKPRIEIKDSAIIFTGIDNEERIKSISKITSITFEELTEFTEDDFDQANLRLRGKHLKEYKQTMGMFNPIDENHWVKNRFVENPPERSSLLFHESTYKDNPHLDEDYINMLNDYEHTNKLYYQVYCLGEWGVVDTSNKFLYSFNPSKHIGHCEYDPYLELHLSFDFNIDPFAVCIYQVDENDKMCIFDQIRLNNSDIMQVCDVIKAKYPDSFYVVTGDASGKNRTGIVRGKDSYWYAIRRELNLRAPQIKLRKQNLGLIESRILCNAAFQNKEIIIHPELTNITEDCKYAKVDDRGVLLKDRKSNKNDFLDTVRYAIDAQWPELIRNPKMMRNNGS